MKYTKEDLVEFAKFNSNAPVSVLRRASLEELERFLKRKPEVWEKFINTLDEYREFRELEKQSNKIHRALRSL